MQQLTGMYNGLIVHGRVVCAVGVSGVAVVSVVAIVSAIVCAFPHHLSPYLHALVLLWVDRFFYPVFFTLEFPMSLRPPLTTFWTGLIPSFANKILRG